MAETPQRGLFALGFTVIGMQDFAAKLLRAALNDEPLDEAALAAIQASCIRDLKDAYPVGLTIEDEAAIIGQAIQNLEEHMRLAIQRARQRD